MAFVPIASHRWGGEIQFHSYIGFYGDTNFEAGDAPTLSGHPVPRQYVETDEGHLAVCQEIASFSRC